SFGPKGSGLLLCRPVRGLVIPCLVPDEEHPLPPMPAISLVGRILAAALLGLGLAAAFAPYDQWWLLALSVAGLTVICAGIRVRAAVFVGFVYGLAFTLGLVPWL